MRDFLGSEVVSRECRALRLGNWEVAAAPRDDVGGVQRRAANRNARRVSPRIGGERREVRNEPSHFLWARVHSACTEEDKIEKYNPKEGRGPRTETSAKAHGASLYARPPIGRVRARLQEVPEEREGRPYAQEQLHATPTGTSNRVWYAAVR